MDNYDDEDKEIERKAENAADEPRMHLRKQVIK